MSTLAEIAIEEVAANDLVPHPENPRPAITNDEVAELRASIEAHGQKQPCIVVRLEDGRYRLVIGHRRAHACALLGRPVLCIVEDLDDDTQLALMLSDNRVRTDPDPLLEAKAVSALLARRGWTVQSVAGALGKSLSWVARRAALKSLPPLVCEVAKENDWPIEWLEQVARLDENVTRSLKKGELEHIDTKWGLDHLLSRRLQVLGKAPWNLEDATLCPRVGSCAECPKTSLRAPGLFDDDADPAAATDLKFAICRDATCWDAKAEAFTVRQVEEAKGAGAKVVVFKSPYGGTSTPLPKAFRGAPVITTETHGLKDAKPLSKGAILACVHTGYQGDGVRWVLDPEVAASTKKAKTTKARDAAKKEESPAERRRKSEESIEARRIAHVLGAFAGAPLQSWKEREAQDRGLLDDLAVMTPSRDAALTLVAMFALEDPYHSFEGDEPRTTLSALSGAAWDLATWTRAVPSVRNATTVLRSGSPSLELLQEYFDVALFVAGLFDAEAEVLDLVWTAVEEIPDPKWWGQSSKTPEAAVAAHQALAASLRKPRGRKAKASAEKACRQCGCTEARACPGGCSWFVRETDGEVTDLCTTCAEANREPAGEEE